MMNDSAAPSGNNAYAELLRDTRGLRREQHHAREAWFTKLSADKKDDILFELEILLKGIACFANPRNHPGAARRRTIVSLDFREHLAFSRDALTRIVQLTRTLLGERDRTFAFHRYLETVLPEDSARSRLLNTSLSQGSPEASLFVLRHGLTNQIEVMNGLIRGRVNYRLFYAALSSVMRETAQSAYFNPMAALEFRPEFDRIASTHVLELIQGVRGEQAHRLVALTFLALFRLLRYLRLIDAIAGDHADRRVGGRAFLLLAVIRSDARALSNFLRSRSGALLSDSFAKELTKTPAAKIHDRFAELNAEGHRLIGIRAALAGVAANLRLEMRRAFEHDLPTVESRQPDQELRTRLRDLSRNLRPALQNAIVFMGRSLGTSLEVGEVFDDLGVKRASSERFRRDVWMFAQIARAFASKAQHANPTDDEWSKVSSFAFVREFLAYFAAMGYPLLRVGDYPRFDQFKSAMSSLEETDLLDPRRLRSAIEEATAFHSYLGALFERICQREELSGIPFDKPAAARALRLYLGD